MTKVDVKISMLNATEKGYWGETHDSEKEYN